MGRDGFAVSLFVQEQRRYSSLGSGYTSTTAGHSDVAAPGRIQTRVQFRNCYTPGSRTFPTEARAAARPGTEAGRSAFLTVGRNDSSYAPAQTRGSALTDEAACKAPLYRLRNAACTEKAH